jgi:hypothetical protein
MQYYFVASFVFAIVAGVIAHSKGRNALGWFVAGLLIGPFAFVVAVLSNMPREGVFVPCAACGEVIRASASTCRYCGSRIEFTP